MFHNSTPTYTVVLEELYAVATWLNDRLNLAMDAPVQLSPRMALETRQRIVAILHAASKIESEFC